MLVWVLHSTKDSESDKLIAIAKPSLPEVTRPSGRNPFVAGWP